MSAVDAPLKVLLISHTCFSRTRGQPKVQRLSDLGVNMRVICPTWWFEDDNVWYPAEAPAADAGFTLEAHQVPYPFHPRLHRYGHFYPRFARVLREFKPDVIDIWEEAWGLASAHACWVRNRVLPQAKIISETEQNINRKLPPPFSQLRKYTLKNADFAIGRNAEAVGVLRAQGYNGPAQVVPNAVDAEIFHPMDREACRMEFGAEGFVVGYAGRLIEAKGLMDLVEAVAKCPAEVRLLLVGAGPYQPDLERRIAELGLGPRARILPNQSPNDLAKIMNTLDVFILPSRTTPNWKEQFGRVIIEAHACGTPVIGSTSGAIPEVVGHGGLVVPERDPAALAQAIQQLLNDPEKRKQMGNVGREEVMNTSTWQQVARQMRDIYQRVARSSVLQSEAAVATGVSSNSFTESARPARGAY
jgi:glycosyltransferase involved in cell wall biosynthesis